MSRCINRNIVPKVHSFCKQCQHKYLVFLNWELMSALASLERFGEEYFVFLNWRSCRHCGLYLFNWMFYQNWQNLVCSQTHNEELHFFENENVSISSFWKVFITICSAWSNSGPQVLCLHHLLHLQNTNCH